MCNLFLTDRVYTVSYCISQPYSAFCDYVDRLESSSVVHTFYRGRFNACRLWVADSEICPSRHEPCEAFVRIKHSSIIRIQNCMSNTLRRHNSHVSTSFVLSTCVTAYDERSCLRRFCYFNKHVYIAGNRSVRRCDFFFWLLWSFFSSLQQGGKIGPPAI